MNATLITPGTYHLTTPNSPLTPKICRDTVAILLATNGHAPGLADTARTLVSELVTNAVLHTASPTIAMETAVLSDGVRRQSGRTPGAARPRLGRGGRERVTPRAGPGAGVGCRHGAPLRP
ncbi:hypothetical protein [Streptomyces avermitilis]|uniref:hypothetical protein n=1 Tax=Streptomyces avermitilis TaxID=33903 RepID=UPI0033AFD98B